MPPGERSRRTVWLAYVSGAFGLAVTAQVNFLVPLRARELGASFDVIGLIVGAGALASALLSVSSGALIDRLGPRRSFMLGAAASASLSLLFLFVTSYWWLLAIQPLLGVAKNLGWVASQSYIAGLGSAQQGPGLVGRFSFFSNAGQMAGPAMIGGVAQVVGFRWAFLFLAAYAASFAFIGRLLPDIRHPDHAADRAKSGTGIGSALELLLIRSMQVALLLNFVRLWTTGLYAAFFPVFLVDTGLEPGVVGSVLAVSGLVAAVFAPTAGFWTRLMSQQTVAALGLGCGVLGLLLAPHLTTVPVVYVIPVLVGVGNGLSLPLLLSIVARAAPAGKRGVSLGMRAAVGQVAATIAPVLVGPIMSGLGIALGFTTGAAVAGSILVGLRLLPQASLRERSCS